MAQRTAGEMISDLMAAGFSRANAIIMAAIGLAESSGNDAAQGDLGLQDATWGPSYGLYQIRTIKSQTGTGQDRDIVALASSDARQAKAAFDIAGGGVDFSPWSTFTSGAYQKYLDQVTAAAEGTGGGVAVQTAGLADSTGISAIISGISAPIRNTVFKVAFATLGLALVAAGIARTMSPTVRRVREPMQEKAKQAAMVAAL